MFSGPCANKYAPVRMQRGLEYDNPRLPVKQYIRHLNAQKRNILCLSSIPFSSPTKAKVTDFQALYPFLSSPTPATSSDFPRLHAKRHPASRGYPKKGTA